MSETTVVHLLRHGEVHNPDEGALRPAARLPPLRLGRQMAERDRRALRRRGHHPRRRRRCERAQETAAPLGGGARPRRCAIDDRLIEAGQRLRGQDVRRRRRRRCGGPRTGCTCATRSARPGASRTTRSPRGCWPRSPPPATPRAATRRSASATSCRSGRPGSFATGRRLWHDPRKRQCALASLTSFTYDGDELVVGVLRGAGARPAAGAGAGTGKKFVAGA